MGNSVVENVGADMGRRLVVVLPLPPQELSPNARPHYMAKARAVKRYREAAHLSALAERPARPMQAAKVTARFFFRTRRRRDRDNLLASLKPAFDGIADARVVTNDSGMIHMPVEQYVDRTDPRVEIVVETVA
jgi:Holliday junction resolvase RusA-like endonuclease